MGLMLTRNKIALRSCAAWQGRAMKRCQRSTPVLLLAVLFAAQPGICNAQPISQGGAVFTITVKSPEETRGKKREAVGCAVELYVERGTVQWTAPDNTRLTVPAGQRVCFDTSGHPTAAGGGAPPSPPPPPGPPTPPPCESPAGRGC
jgi:hypothetical protein